MMPQMQNTLLNWGEWVQMKIISKQPVDFEVQDNVLAVLTIDMMLTAMKSKDVNRKPEGERIWKWWNGITRETIESDTVLQDPNGVEYRVMNTNDWSQAGFFLCELVQQPQGTA